MSKPKLGKKKVPVYCEIPHNCEDPCCNCYNNVLVAGGGRTKVKDKKS